MQPEHMRLVKEGRTGIWGLLGLAWPHWMAAAWCRGYLQLGSTGGMRGDERSFRSNVKQLLPLSFKPPHAPPKACVLLISGRALCGSITEPWLVLIEVSRSSFFAD